MKRENKKLKKSNSRLHFEGEGSLLKCKRSQITIFVIIALLIIGVLVILFYPQIKKIIIPPAPGELIPTACVESAVKESMNLTMMHGGKIKPELYFMYNNETLDYLCYTSEWYKTCIMQKPLLKQSIEAEVEVYMQANISKCISQMEDTLKARGYDVKISGSRKAEISIVPDKIDASFNMSMTIQKGDEPSQTFPSSRFKTEFKSNAYEIIMIASSIQNWEARYGDSVPESYMSFYPNLRVEKKKQDDGTKVYIISDRDTGEKLQFTTRSLAWPPGYAIPPATAVAGV